jgi:GTP cyclohydrolase I
VKREGFIFDDQYQEVRLAVVALLKALGHEAVDGLADTPHRVARMLRFEMTAGYDENPADILAAVFDGSDYDQMIIVKGMEFVSLCEHHLLPFSGTVTIGYLPSHNKVVGLSKLGRLVDCFARRLQMQERLTMQIARAIEEHLQPLGVGVIVSAEHSCMGIRGVRKRGETVTSALLGSFRDEQTVRDEFLNLARR